MAWPDDGAIWFSYCDKVRDVAVSLLSASSIPTGSGRALATPKVFAAALLSRSVLNLKGVVVTAGAGLLVEAGTLARCCVENSLWMRRLHDDGEGFSRAIIDDNAQQVTSLVKRIPSEVLLSFDDEERAFVSCALKAKKTRKILMGEGTPTEDGERDYLMFKLLSGHFAHPSALSLSHHLGLDHVHGAREIIVDPSLTLKDFNGVFLYAALAMLSMMERYCDIVLGNSLNQDVTALEAELVELRKKVDPTSV